MLLAEAITVSDICTILTTLVGLIPAIVGCVVFLVKVIKNKNWNALKEVADAAMKEAEAYAKAHPGMTGDQKLDMALEIIQASASKMGVKINDALLSQLKVYIKQTISWFNDMKK